MGVGRDIIHLDMDAFYASVEQRDRPELRGKPVIVGGHERRGVVTAASYEVRPFGVRSAMPMARAMKLAPHAIVVTPRFHAYVEASEQVFSIMERFTPLIEPLSLDEAFLDVTASRGLFGSPWEMALQLRAQIFHEVQLPASAGISGVKFLSKIASDFAKPQGQHEVPRGEERAFLAPLPVARLWGVGAKTEAGLHAMGLKTVGDVAAKDREWLEKKLGAQGGFLWELAQGIDDRAVVPDRAAKSIGAEDTFNEDLSGKDVLAPHIHEQALRVGRRLRRASVRARVVVLKLKLNDFTLLTRRSTLETPTDDGQVLYREALRLLDKTPLRLPVRLTGISAQDLSAEAPQLGLFQAPPSRSDKLNEALDRINQRFGGTTVTTADVQGVRSAREEDTVHRSYGSLKSDR